MLKAAFLILRPLNLMITVPAVFLGSLMAAPPGTLQLKLTLTALFATLFSLAAGNLWNDIADQQEDRINRPDRPLPSGQLSAPFVAVYSILLALAALFLASLIAKEALLLVIACQAALGWYALRGKSIIFLGNLVVGALTGIAVLFGAMVQGDFMAALEPALLAFVVNLMREIVKDKEDSEGDRQAGRRSLAMILPQKNLSWLLFIIATLFPLGLLAAKLQVFPSPQGFGYSTLRWGLLCVSPIFLALPFLPGFSASRTTMTTMTWGALSSILKGTLMLGVSLYLVVAILQGAP
jgi:geranylgeranylglycerol-phosphate geranylgeranyltransferase